MIKDQKQQPKLSKKWIDFSGSSDQDEQITTTHQENHNTYKIHNHERDTKYADSLTPNLNLKDNTKLQMSLLKDVKGDQVWFQLTCKSNYEYLLQKTSSLEKEKEINKQILFIYPTIGKQGSAYYVKVHINLAQDWILTGIDEKNLIHCQIASRNFTKHTTKKHNQRRNYKTYGEKVKCFKPKFQQKLQTKKKYVQKGQMKKKQAQHGVASKGQQILPKAQDETKTEQVKKTDKKDKAKNKKQSNFYSKNPFAEFDQSD